jgi:hypothetical protein
VGVFISFTLSQAGMVVHWKKDPEQATRARILINGFGASITGIVFFVVVSTKFLSGAWIVVVAIPLMILLMRSIAAHYKDVASQLAHPDRLPTDRRAGDQSMVILVREADAATARAVGYVRAVRPREATAVCFSESVARDFISMAPEIQVVVLDGAGRTPKVIKAHLEETRRKLPSADFLTLVVPEMLQGRGLWEIVRRPAIHRLKASFLSEPDVQVLDLPLVRGDVGPETATAEPTRHFVVVLVAGVHNASLQAIEYAETLNPYDLRAVSFGLDLDAVDKLAEDWLERKIPVPLELEDSPYRDIGQSLVDYVRRLRPDGRDRMVTVVIPEFVVSKKHHQLLHGQTALLVKRQLLFERGVAVASVPYHLED